MWYVCKLAFENGECGIEARTYEGIKQGMRDVIREWHDAKVVGVEVKKIDPNRIKQGRCGEYVRDHYTEGVRV